MAALSILTLKFVAIGLTKELAGNYNSAYGYLQLFGIIADFGIYAVAVREVSRAQDRGEVLGGLMVLRSITLVLSLSAALAFAWLNPLWRGTPLPLGITIAALVPFFTLLAGIVRTIFQVMYRMHLVFTAEVIQRIVTTALMGVFIFLGVRGSNDLHTYHLFLFIGGIGAFVLFFLSMLYGNRLVSVQLRIDIPLMRSLLAQALPYGIAYLCLALYRQFDITLIALLRPDFELQNAYYGFVLRMTDMGFVLPTFLLNSALPILSQEEGVHDRGRLLGKIFLSVLLIGITSSLFALLWARPLVELLTTPAYLSRPGQPGSDTALTLLSLPLLLNGIILYGFYVLLIHHRWRQLVMTLAFGALLSLLLNALLIPPLGFVGASVVSIIVHTTLTILLFPQSFRVSPPLLERRELGRVLLFIILLALGLLLIHPLLKTPLATLIGLGGAAFWMLLIFGCTGLRRILWD